MTEWKLPRPFSLLKNTSKTEVLFASTVVILGLSSKAVECSISGSIAAKLSLNGDSLESYNVFFAMLILNISPF